MNNHWNHSWPPPGGFLLEKTWQQKSTAPPMIWLNLKVAFTTKSEPMKLRTKGYSYQMAQCLSALPQIKGFGDSSWSVLEVFLIELKNAMMKTPKSILTFLQACTSGLYFCPFCQVSFRRAHTRCSMCKFCTYGLWRKRDIIRLPPARWLSFCPERISD